MVVSIMLGKRRLPNLNESGVVQFRSLERICAGDYSPRAQIVLSRADTRELPFVEIVQRLSACGHGHELYI